MDETYNTKVIIIKREPYRERDSRVQVYSPNNGKFDLIARGTGTLKSKMSGFIEPISYVNIMVVRGRKRNYLGNTVGLKGYINIKEDLVRVSQAGRALAFFNKQVKPNDATDAREIFNLLRSFLDVLNDLSVNSKILEFFYNIFTLKLLVILGFMPELYSCSECKKKITPKNNYFSPARGGVICSNCAKGNKVSVLTITDSCVKVLRLIVKTDINKLSKLKIEDSLIKEATKIIDLFKKYYTNL